ncbi:MAG TPA: DUF1707 domain-containing protein [Solirubrobacteraceae bacterium]|nr:DUF1707 domain-containing protein [Solirubrobacteraceae bacterium]
MRVSDAEREQAAGLLREHWLAGRLDAGEFDERSSEVWSARTDRELAFSMRGLPATSSPSVRTEPGDSTLAIASLVLGVVGLSLLLVSFGLLAFLALPLSATAWGLGRRARRQPGAGGNTQATAGVVLGIVGTALSALLLGGCATLFL